MSRIAKAAAVLAGTGAVALTGAGLAVADAGAQAAAVGSPGVGSGNVVQVPIHIPINLCGNSVSVIGALNPAFGNTCINADGPAPRGDGSAPGTDGGPVVGMPGPVGDWVQGPGGNGSAPDTAPVGYGD